MGGVSFVSAIFSHVTVNELDFVQFVDVLVTDF